MASDGNGSGLPQAQTGLVLGVVVVVVVLLLVCCCALTRSRRYRAYHSRRWLDRRRRGFYDSASRHANSEPTSESSEPASTEPAGSQNRRSHRRRQQRYGFFGRPRRRPSDAETAETRDAALLRQRMAMLAREEQLRQAHAARRAALLANVRTRHIALHDIKMADGYVVQQPPMRIPPTVRPAPYRMTQQPQFPGTSRTPGRRR